MDVQKKRYSKIDEQQWEQIRALVEEYFQQPEKASRATYNLLFKEIQIKYPCIVLSPQLFTTHIASIETLRANAGIQGEVEKSRKYFQRVSEIFHEILIGLPLDKCKSIRLNGLIQRADELYPDLHLIERNRITLAKHCPIKQLKALALQERLANAPVAQTVQAQGPADPPALGAAAGIERLGEGRGLPGVQAAGIRPHNRCRNVFDPSDAEGEDDPDGDVDVDCAPPHGNQDDTSRDAQGVFGGDMDGVIAPPPAFQAAACSAKPQAASDAEAEGHCAHGTCHGLDLILGYGDSNHSSSHESLLEAERVLNEANQAIMPVRLRPECGGYRTGGFELQRGGSLEQ